MGERNNYYRKGANEYTIELVGEKMFLLDSMTAQTVNYMQLLGDTSLAIFNSPMNNICLFDWTTGKEKLKINLHKEGPNAVRGIRGFYFQSKDSIWLYNEWKKELYLVDADGNLKEKRHLQDLLYPIAKQLYSVSPFPQTNVPIRKVDNKLVLQGMNDVISDEVFPAVTILYDLNVSKLDIKNPYPAVYSNKNKINDEWNTFAYRQVPYTLNDKKEIVSGFPASDSIVVYNMNTDSYTSVFAGYSEETNIKPYVPTSRTATQRNYLEQYQYTSILYDTYRNLYYRLVVLPKTDYDLNDAATQHKDLAVIILSKDFKKVGEYQLEHDQYMYINSFVASDGLCINVFSEDDDYLKFKVLKVTKNEK
ncbi:DUF4221 family protein [Parabacteroides bouchesdurhonensis]|uniref:DUF4221 family protein n=1 Tax=Parabacteroides bouchesdurhonensis TaxID=1936995 RepID=UPI000E46E0BE|nr:DUF4221 family protein [Parabacteroides bouchesdurhonensis]RHJ91733.1 DUF4221 domain-containing protein [Bacteroides sp. AM07-16]